MKRDMDLIRELMLRLEALPVAPGSTLHLAPDSREVQVEGYDADQIDYHLLLINGAGFITRSTKPAPSGIYFRRLTWAGHDFLDSVRSPDVWDRTKQAASAAGGFTVDLLVLAAKTYLEGKIKGVIGG
jgi:hypothetical protein